MTQTTSIGAADAEDDRQFDRYLASIQKRVEVLSRGPLFTTDAEGLFAAYLAGLPEMNRQYHTCHACRRFFENYGGLVTIAEDGTVVPALWYLDDAPGYYRTAIAAVERLVRRARVTGVFLTGDRRWGIHDSPKNAKHGGAGSWTHYSVAWPAAYHNPVKTAYQAAAEKREDRANVARALGEFPADKVALAVGILRADALYRSEKVLGPAKFLEELHAAREKAAGKDRRENVVWRVVATAPAGFCHPRSSMVGTLLEDLVAGLPVEDVTRKFAEKMHPLRYQRPTAAPTAGAIEAAEKLVEQMGIRPSLARRYARLDEVEAFWRPTDEPKPDYSTTDGVFSHLRPKGSKVESSEVVIPGGTVTWEKFARVALPDVTQIELFAPYSGNYSAIVTAADPDAPPIIQWDCAERRNPCSWYVWHGGSQASQWGLVGGDWVKVAALAKKPSAWHDEGKAAHFGAGVFFVLEGARESREHGVGAALFPEVLRGELHAVRSVIEAYSRSATIAGREEASACGLLFENNSGGVRLRVTASGGQRTEYAIDRLD